MIREHHKRSQKNGGEAVCRTGFTRGTMTAAALFAAVLLFLTAGSSVPAYAADESGETEIAETAAVDEETGVPSTSTDEDTLLETYLKQKAGIGTSSAASSGSSRIRKSPRRNILSGVSLNIYNSLKEQITKVADGESSSAVFTIPAATAHSGTGSTEGPARRYTKADLMNYGLSSGDSLVSNGSITDEALSAMAALYMDKYGGISGSAVVNALLTDCPYELYWFNKTSSGGFAWDQVPYVAGSASGLYFSNIHFYFAVSSRYQGSGYNDEETYIGKKYSLNTAVTKSAKSAVANAKKVVSDYAGLGDYAKLRAYYDYIRNAVTYDSSASGYGDPWQIIYVFDGNSTTNVVCEGYSKAFQFLFNLSTFQSASIDCNLVTGKIATGDHMWNIVTMEDGANYLADLTNGRFLVGGTEYSSGLTEKYPKACRVNDGTVYWYDSDTTGLYSSSELALSARNYGASSAASQTTETQTTETQVTSDTGSPDASGTAITTTRTEEPSSSSASETGSTSSSGTGSTGTSGSTGSTGGTATKNAGTNSTGSTGGTTKGTGSTSGTTKGTGSTSGTTKGTGSTSGTAAETTGSTTKSAGNTTKTAGSTAGSSKNKTTGTASSAADKSTKGSTAGTKSTAAKKTSAVDKKVLAAKGEKEVSGSSYSPLFARVKSAKKTSITVRWNKVAGAKMYVVYYTKCGSKFTSKNIKKAGSGSTSVTIKGLKKGTAYKIVVEALKAKNDATKKITVSKAVHAWTTGGKYGNYRSVKLNRTKLTLKKGKTFRIKATLKKAGKKVKTHRKVQYVSSNKKIATVTSSGKIRAKKKGTCRIYVYAQDGTYNTVKVTVK